MGEKQPLGVPMMLALRGSSTQGCFARVLTFFCVFDWQNEKGSRTTNAGRKVACPNFAGRASVAGAHAQSVPLWTFVELATHEHLRHRFCGNY